MEESVEAVEVEEEAEATEEVIKEKEAPEEEEVEAAEEEEIEVKEKKEVEKEKKKEEIEEEEIVEERFYTIPLRKAWISPRKKRAPKAMRIIKSFVKRHMKLRTEAEGDEAESLVVSKEVNEKIWGRGIEKPPRKIRVRAAKDKEGVTTVHLAEGD